MPNIIFPRVTPGLTRSIFLFGLQLYPEDEARGRFLDSFQAAAWGHFLSSPASFNITVEARFAAWLASAPKLDNADVNSRIQKGKMAGFMLHFILNCSVVPDLLRYASVSAACRIVERAWPGKRGFKRDTIKRFTWDLYEPVAHLWAAWYAWRVELERLPGSVIGPEEPDVAEFLSLAETFRIAGEQWSHENGPSILDSTKTWKASEADTAPYKTSYAFKGAIHQDFIDLARAS